MQSSFFNTFWTCLLGPTSRAHFLKVFVDFGVLLSTALADGGAWHAPLRATTIVRRHHTGATVPPSCSSRALWDRPSIASTVAVLEASSWLLHLVICGSAALGANARRGHKPAGGEGQQGGQPHHDDGRCRWLQRAGGGARAPTLKLYRH